MSSQRQKSVQKIKLNIQQTLDLYCSKQFEPGYYKQHEDKHEKRSKSEFKKTGFQGIYPVNVDFNDGFYQGALDLEKRPDGPGIFYSDEGNFYIGEWNQAAVHGKGLLVLNKGHFFYGSFRQGKVHGYGLLSYISGVILCGVWQNNRLHGQASFFVHKNSSWILAEFKLGKLMKYIREERVKVGPTIGYPTQIDIHKSHQSLITDIENASILKNVELFQSETQRSSYSQIKSQRLETGSCYVGFVLNESQNLSGLGTVIKDWSIPFYGHLKNASLNGTGKFYLSDKASFTGSFKEGKFSGQGCLVSNNQQWKAGRWNGGDLVMADNHSGKGQAQLWIKKHYAEVHSRSNKYNNVAIKLDKMIEPAFELVHEYDVMLSKIQAFAPLVPIEPYQVQAPHRTIYQGAIDQTLSANQIIEENKQREVVKQRMKLVTYEIDNKQKKSILKASTLQPPNNQPIINVTHSAIKMNNPTINVNSDKKQRIEDIPSNNQNVNGIYNVKHLQGNEQIMYSQNNHTHREHFTPIVHSPISNKILETDLSEIIEQKKTPSRNRNKIFHPQQTTQNNRFIYSESEYNFIYK